VTSANRLRTSFVRESTLGVTPTTPRMRNMRITGESLQFNPEYIDSDEIRDDRMTSDPILTMQSSGGGVNFELSYPEDNTALSEIFRSAFYNPWVNTPQRENDGVADSVITDVATTGVITVTTGPAFAVGHVIRNTGFGVAQNNGVFVITTGSATVPSVGAALLALEAAPPATARMKVVGFQGATGDITATATGLGSTTLNFTTLGLIVGQVLKIGATAAITQFNTVPNNAFVRITAIAANAITLDNLPIGWAIDSGVGKTIRVWFGDTIKNGVTTSSLTIERGFMAQAVPNYIVNRGMVVNTMQINASSKQKITGSATFSGLSGGISTTSLDVAPDPATTWPVIGANAGTQRITEAGATIQGSNWFRSLELTINNNLRMLESVGDLSPVDIQPGEATITGRAEAYFSSAALVQKFYTGTATSVLMVSARQNKAIAFQIPRMTYRSGGNPSASAKNTDVTVNFDFTASFDTLTGAHITADRFDYYE
jgi:hypothetical protein